MFVTEVGCWDSIGRPPAQWADVLSTWLPWPAADMELLLLFWISLNAWTYNDTVPLMQLWACRVQWLGTVKRPVSMVHTDLGWQCTNTTRRHLTCWLALMRLQTDRTSPCGLVVGVDALWEKEQRGRPLITMFHWWWLRLTAVKRKPSCLEKYVDFSYLKLVESQAPCSKIILASRKWITVWVVRFLLMSPFEFSLIESILQDRIQEKPRVFLNLVFSPRPLNQ